MVHGQAAAGDDAVHMYVIKKLPVPGVQYLDDAGRCPEELFICRKLQERLGTAFVKEAVKQLMVTIDGRTQFVWQCKNDVKVRCVDDFFAALMMDIDRGGI